MGQYVNAVWQPKDTVSCEPVAYRAWMPEPIAELPDLRITQRQTAAAAVTAAAMTRFCSSATAAASDWFLRVAEGAASTTIEGVHPSPRRLLRAQFSGKGRESEVEALANVDAIAEALKIGSDAQAGLTVEDVCRIHERLARRLYGYEELHGQAPGEIRRKQSWIGGGGVLARSADNIGPAHPFVSFVPPPPENVRPLMEDLIAFCNRTDLPAIPQAAIAHAQFETIHPFPDGNGRTGRALVHAMWSKRMLAAPNATIPFSSFLAMRRDDYIDSLQAFRSVGALAGTPDVIDPIVNLFLAATARALVCAHRIGENLQARLDAWRAVLKPRQGGPLYRVLGSLISQPAFDALTLAERHGLTGRQAARVVRQLVQGGVAERRNAGPGIWCYEAVALMDEFKASFPQGFPYDDDDHREPMKPAISDGGGLVDEWTEAEGYEGAWVSPDARSECGVLMPRAQKRCVLSAGHAGRHRSVKPWKKKR